MGKTRKVKQTGKFGTRYGSNVRKAYREITGKMNNKVKCPQCETAGTLRRLSTGIWNCKKCEAVFTGGAYYINTPRGLESDRVAKRKQREVEGLEESL